MIVYGDPSFELPARCALDQLRGRIQELLNDGSVSPPDLRLLLIHAGQVEQGMCDALGGKGAADAVAQVTDHAAGALLAGRGGHRSNVRERLEAAAGIISQLRVPADLHLRIKMPEGYAFYALYPEQYAQAARKWMMEHDLPAALVVGIRSIGTSLSAIVMQALRLAGREAHRITLRPEGLPFERRARIDAAQLGDATCALVVDEGPGMSGSSMASAAAALVDLGMARERIAFLPAHGNPPGPAVGREVRQWWDSVVRCPAEAHSPLAGPSVAQSLARHTRRLRGCNAAVAAIEDLSAGQWRGVIWNDPDDWPAAWPAFERLKHRCVQDEGRAVLWKFAGLGIGADGRDLAHAALDRMRRLSRHGWCPPPLGTAMGYIATRWIDGRPLGAGDVSPRILGHIGEYIADSAGPPLGLEELRAGFGRLSEMLLANAHEALGEGAAECARRIARSVEDAADAPLPAAGDGRLGPVEWLRDSSGRLFKTDCGGHAIDHTIVGAQPITWDIASALIEWQLDDAAQHLVIDAVQSSAGIAIHDELLLFHCMAYAAFRMGQCVLCSSLTADPDERCRLLRAATMYRESIPRRFACRI